MYGSTFRRFSRKERGRITLGDGVVTGIRVPYTKGADVPLLLTNKLRSTQGPSHTDVTSLLYLLFYFRSESHSRNHWVNRFTTMIHNQDRDGGKVYPGERRLVCPVRPVVVVSKIFKSLSRCNRMCHSFTHDPSSFSFRLFSGDNFSSSTTTTTTTVTDPSTPRLTFIGIR